MDFDRIRHAMAHYEAIHGRLWFKVRAWKNEGDKKDKEKYTVQPLIQGTVTYGTHETKEAAEKEADELNQRSAEFLGKEYELVRQVLLDEAMDQ